MSARSLADLLSPESEDVFFNRYWGKKPWILQRKTSGIFSDLPDSAEFEFLARSLTNPRDGWFSAVKDVARPVPDSMLTDEGLLNLSQIYSTYNDGNSLLLNQVQRRHPSTSRLCRSLEQTFADRGIDLARHIGANAYLSPPASQGFRIHYDPHDVLVLQLEGRKHWRIYRWHEQRWPRMAPTSPTDPAHAGPPEHEFTLSVGDLLYLPRGMLHDAFTTDSRSLHLTLSIETLTWSNLMEELLRACGDLGKDLPRGYLRGARRADATNELRRMALLLLNRRAVSRARSTLAGRLLANLDPLANGGIDRVDAAAGITAATWLEQCDGNFGYVEKTSDEVVLHLPGTTLRADVSMEQAFRYVLERSRVRAKDLPTSSPRRAKVSFMRELVKLGFLFPIPKGRTHD